jgi:putative aldouronate transport system substrate-binding protein
MRSAAAVLLLACLSLPGLHAGGGREKPGDARFDVTGRIEELRLPISTKPVTVSLWAPLPVGAGVPNLGDLQIYREAARRTGVTVRFVHPAAGREQADLAALAASGDPPDMVATDWSRVPGGPSAALAQGLIIPLNEVIQTWMPGYRAMLARRPAEARSLRTDEGHYYAFPVLAWSDPAIAPAVGVPGGLQARGDVLERLKITPPRTLEDWDAALRLLKKEPGIETPLLLRLPMLSLTHVFASGHGTAFGFFRAEGKVKYGPLEPGFRDFLALLTVWVKDGLLNADLGTLDAAGEQARIAAGKAAAWVETRDAFPRLAAALKAREAGAVLVGLAPPSRKAGEPALLAAGDTWTGIVGDRGVAFSSAIVKARVAAQWVDYWYGDEGRMLQQYGIPGDTYRLLPDGRPELTPAGRGRRFSGGVTLFGHFDGGAWRARSPALADAATLWARAATADHALPVTGGGSAADAATLARATALVEEATAAIVSGARPPESYDDTVKRLEELGIGRLVEARQAQLERSLAR